MTGRDPGAGWIGFLVLGLLFVIAGLLSMTLPLMTGAPAFRPVGGALAGGGGLQVLLGLRYSGWRGGSWYVLAGCCLLAGGLVLALGVRTGVTDPHGQLAGVFFVHGALQAGLALRMRPAAAWGWMLVCALVSLAVGWALVRGFPSTAAHVPGLLTGGSLTVTGWGHVYLGLARRT